MAKMALEAQRKKINVCETCTSIDFFFLLFFITVKLKTVWKPGGRNTHKFNVNTTTKSSSDTRPAAYIQYMSITIWYRFLLALREQGGRNRSHRSPSLAMLIHQSVFRTLTSGNLITSDLGWQEAGLTDNTNSFIMGERLCCATVDPLSDAAIVAAAVILGEEVSTHKARLKNDVPYLSAAGYVLSTAIWCSHWVKC